MSQAPLRPLTAVTALVLFACTSEAPITEVAGECADAFQAPLCSWATTQGDEVLAVGATVAVASISNAPDQMPMAWPPPMVATVGLPDVAREKTGLTHLTMYWEPMGHMPDAYMVPHFDFHFYTIPSGERDAIDCSDLTKPAALPDAYSLPDEELPPEFAAIAGVDKLVGVCVPEMGMHSLPTAELTSKVPFRGTMVVGYYRGSHIFIEPMVPHAVLMERRSFDLAIPTIPGRTGPLPTTFRAEYDPGQDAYRFTFSGIASAP